MFGFSRHHLFWIAWGTAIALLSVALFWAVQEQALRVYFLDVGQGDATLVRTAAGRELLIDTGPSGSKITEKLSAYMPFYDRSLDLIILTHPDKDHIAGAAAVLKSYEVGGIIMPYTTKDTAVFNEVLVMVRERHIPVLFAETGDRVHVDGETFFDIIWPAPGAENIFPFKDTNDMSVVARLVYGNDTFLFTGDLEERSERLVDALGWGAHADVLKVGHHGSAGATSQAFLDTVSPHIVAISAGKGNPYGHPRQIILDRLAHAGVKTLRTDENGDILLTSHGNSF